MDEMESSGNGRKTFYALFGIFLAVAVLIVLTKTSPKNVSTETAGATSQLTSCPDDYCLDWVYGSCSGAGERYRERTCFDYPDSAASADACEQGKRIYYDKGSQPDQTC